MTMKIEPVTIILAIAVCIIIYGGGLFTGIGLTNKHHEKLPPKVENNYTTQETKTSSVQNSMQGQITVIVQPTSGSNVKFVNVNFNGLTNCIYRMSSKSNSITNR